MIMETVGAYSLLKLVLGCTIAGTAVTMATDEDIRKLVKWEGKFRLKKVKKFNIGNEHSTVLGLTQHGKTYATIKTLESMNEPVLFFNSQHTPVGKGWVWASGTNAPAQLIYGLKQGYKINFLPSDDLDGMSKQLKALTDEIYQQGRLSFRFVIDEVQLFDMATDKGGKKSLQRLATTGLGRGFKCVFLSQRPAKVDNTLYTQSTKHIIFALGKMDESYLKTNGFPVDEITKMTGNEKYKFVEFDQKNVKGSFMIG